MEQNDNCKANFLFRRLFSETNFHKILLISSAHYILPRSFSLDRDELLCLLYFNTTNGRVNIAADQRDLRERCFLFGYIYRGYLPSN